MAIPIDVGVANRAILAVGARGQIASASEQSAEARYVRAFYEVTLRSLLRSAHWNFARKTAFLNQLKSAPGALGNTAPGTAVWDPATQPPPPWLFEYAYPDDCLKMRFVSPQVSNLGVQGTPIFSTPSNIPVPVGTFRPQRFQEATDENFADGQRTVVLCNQAQAIGVYTVMVANPTLWDAQFTIAFENVLGARMVIPLSGDKKMASDAKQEAKEIVLSARVTDGNEGLTYTADTQRVPDWLSVRGYAGDWPTGGYFFGAFDNPAFLMI
jgi:hypothetical protein